VEGGEQNVPSYGSGSQLKEIQQVEIGNKKHHLKLI